jgi:hypothetical protein
MPTDTSLHTTYLWISKQVLSRLNIAPRQNRVRRPRLHVLSGVLSELGS